MPKNVGKKGNKHVEQKNQVIDFFKNRGEKVNNPSPKGEGLVKALID